MSTALEHSRLTSDQQRRALVALDRRLVERISQWFPMSSGQRRLWILDQLDLGGAAYNQVVCLRLEGDLSLPAIEQAVQSLIARHEVFRSTFGEHEGEPCQRVDAPWYLPLDVEDVSALEPGRREEELDRLLATEISAPFELRAGKLLRARVFQLGADEHVLLLVTHHICFDGWSRGVLMHDLEQDYNAAVTSGRIAARPLAQQYGDFARWEQDRLKSEPIAKELLGWRERLHGSVDLALPTDHTRLASRSQKGAHSERVLKPRLADAVVSLAQRERASPFMVLLAAFVALLQRYTGQDDVVVGSPSANRSHREFEPIIGFFVNTLVLRTDLAGDPTLLEVLHRVRDAALDAFGGREVPFEKVVEALGVERDVTRNPLVQVTFSQRMPRSEIQLQELRVTPMLLDVQTSRFDLECYVGNDNGVLTAYMVYSTDLFSVKTIEQLLTHYELMLEALVVNAGQRLMDVELVVGEARRQVLVEWNDTATGYPRDESIVSIFSNQVSRRGDARALEFGNRCMSYVELDEASSAVAASLGERGIRRGDVVGVLLPRSPEMVACWLGILKVGATYLPLDPAYPASRLDFMLRDAGALVLLVSGEIEGVPVGGTTVILHANEAMSRESLREWKIEEPGDALDAAYIVYTSGSTGEPKGVVVPHRGVVRLVCETDYLQLGPHDRVAQASNASFDAATFEVWGSLLNGGCLVGVEPETVLDPVCFGVWLLESEVTALFVTTALFNQFSYLAPSGFNTLDALLFGGEAVDVEAVRRVKAAGGPRRLLHVYGPTESTTFSSWYEIGDVPEDAVTIPIGRAVANTRLYVLGERQELLPVGVEGELYIGGDGLARGYLNRDALTAERFLELGSLGGERVYRTGDRVRWRNSGVLEFVSRRDHQVKVRGYRIELGEVEIALASQPRVREAVVLCREDIPGDKRLVGYVVLEPDADTSVEALRGRLREDLPAYMVPSAVVALASMPLTPVGKIDRAALPAPDGGDRVDEYFVAPSGTVEEQIAAIWREVLHTDRISAEDSFFDLGGHSLLATQLVSRVRKNLGVDLTLREVFARPTVRAIAEQVRAALAEPASMRAAAVPIPRRRHAGKATLSFAQKRMWFLSHLDVAAEAYTVLVPLQLRGALDVARIGRAFYNLVHRHEVLRTTFEMQNGEVVQVIHPPGVIEVPVSEAPGGAGFDDEVVSAWLSGIRAEGFDLERGPLVRVALLRCAAEEHVLAISMHHIVTDGWSMDILLRELGILYDDQRGDGSVLPPLQIQYADFAEWQVGLANGELLTPQLDYWRGQLKHLSALDLPTDRPRAASQTFTGARRRMRLDATLVQGLEQLGRDEGATLFITMLAAFAVMLHRYTDQDDIALGSPIANRNHADLEPLIGFFVNTLVMRIDAGGSPSFRELLARTRDVALAAYSNQDVPFEMLVNELQPVRDASRNPLFQVLFLLQRVDALTLNIGDLETSPLPSRTESTRFDLECHVWHRDDGVEVNIVYNVQLFDDATIERLLGHYRRLLEGAIENPDWSIGEINMLAAEERQHLLVELNDTALDFPRDMTIHGWFEAQVARTPDAVAVRDRDSALTYAELNDRAEALAGRLRELGAGPEVLVGLCLERSADLVVGMLGILKSGSAYVPLDPQYPRDRIEFMLDDAGVPLLVTKSVLSDRFEGRKLDLVCIDQPLDAVSRTTGQHARADNLAYVLYTSGSTGRPKGVAIEHRSASALIAWAGNTFEAREWRGVLASTSVCFDLSVFEIFCPLAVGGSVIVVENLFELPSLPCKADVSLINSVPSVMRELLRGDVIPGSVVTVNLAGEPLPAELVEEIYRASEVERVYDLYGPSEDTTYSTWTLRRGDGPATIGRPISNTSVYLLDRYGQPVPKGMAGELCIAGSGLAREYLNRPELTAEKFVADPFSRKAAARMYRTGDRARYFPDGTLEYLGRIDQQVKLRGFRIELGEIEATLMAHPSVRECVVTCREDVPGDPRLVAYVVGSGDGKLSPGELRAHIGTRLPGFMMPAAFMELDAIPLTPNGKIDRLRLPAPGGARQVEDVYVAPRTELESRISGLWCEVLRVDRVGIHDNFFDLGGSSLLLVKLKVRIAEETGVDVPVVELFRHPSVHEVAAYLDGRGKGAVDRESANRRARMRRASGARYKSRVPRRATAAAGRADTDGNEHEK